MTQEELRKDIAQREERLARLTKAGTLIPEAQKQYAEKIASLKAQLTDEKKETPKKEPKAKAIQPSLDLEKETLANLKTRLASLEGKKQDWIVGKGRSEREIEKRSMQQSPYDSEIDDIQTEITRRQNAKKPTKKVAMPKPKATPKPKAMPKPKASGEVESDEEIPTKVPRKRGRKKKVVATTTPKPKKQYVPRVAPAEGEPDCDTLLLQFRERRTKAQKNARKRKTTPVFRKIATDVVDAVEKAIKNVPKKTLKESPKQTIRKFGTLQRAAESFLKAFKGILGEDYQEKSANVELKELERLIKALIKKYGA